MAGPALTITRLEKSFGERAILEGASLRVTPGERLGLVGPNGQGKTTILRMLAGEEEPDVLEGTGLAGLRIALHDQRPPAFDAQVTLGDYLAEALAAVHEAAARLERTQAALEADPTSESALERYGAALEAFDHAGGYEADSRLAAAARGLGFTPEADFGRALASFSGGELTRASLARALASNPDLLLLDEPTNHLDLATADWLAEFLAESGQTLIAVSHDRAFLDRVSTTILELNRATLRRWPGDYTAFRAAKAEDLRRQREVYDEAMAERARLQAYVDKFRAGTRARQAQSRLKALERMPVPDDPETERAAMSFRFPLAARSARVVIDAHDVDLSIGDRRLLDGASFAIERGDRVALIGANGTGKTSLLQAIAAAGGIDAAVPGRTAPELGANGGTLALGSGVEVGYYSQHAHELGERGTPLAHLEAAGVPTLQARTLLGRFGFHGEAALRDMSGLSGGERSRVALARLLASGANLLVLDEPTNHLDIPGCEALETALLAYTGTLLLVSHDRALVDAIVTKVVALHDGRVDLSVGNYSRYLAGVGQPAAATTAAVDGGRRRDGRESRRRPAQTTTGAEPAPGAGPAVAAPPTREARAAAREAKRLEDRIATVEGRVRAAEAAVAASQGSDAAAVETHARLTAELATLYRSWEDVAARA